MFLLLGDSRLTQSTQYSVFFVLNFQALPYWDWTGIYDKECLIDNPYKIQDGLTEEDCSACQHLKGVKRIANASQSEIAESFLFNQIPVIVTDAVEGWDALEKFDLNYLAEVPRAIPFNNQPLPMGDSFWRGVQFIFKGGGCVDALDLWNISEGYEKKLFSFFGRGGWSISDVGTVLLFLIFFFLKG